MGRRRDHYWISGNNIFSFVALVIIVYFIGVPLFVAVLSGVFGSVSGAIVAFIDLLPFGEVLDLIVCNILNNVLDVSISFHATKGYVTLSYVLQELSQAVFTMFVFEILKFFVLNGMEVTGDGRWTAAKRVLATVFLALISACLAPWLINFALDQLRIAGANGGVGLILSNILSHVLFFVITFGAIALFWLVLGFTVAEAILIILVKKVLLDFFRLMFSYALMLVVMISFETHMFGFAPLALSAMLVIMIMLGVIEMILGTILPEY